MEELVLTIRMAPTGDLELEGTALLVDKRVCYAMLECARDAIKDHFDKATTSRIVEAPPGVPLDQLVSQGR